MEDTEDDKGLHTFPRCKKCGEIRYHPDRFPRLELCSKCQKLLYKVYRTRITPLAGEYGFPPKNVEEELRRKLIERDEFFDDTTIEE